MPKAGAVGGSPVPQNINVSDVTQNEAIVSGQQLGNVKKASGWALAGRILLGIFTLGISEGIRAIVVSVKSKAPSQPKLNVKTEPNSIEDDKLTSMDKILSSDHPRIIEDFKYDGALKKILFKIIENNLSLRSWNNLEKIFSDVSNETIAFKLPEDLKTKTADKVIDCFKLLDWSAQSCLGRLVSSELVIPGDEDMVKKLVTVALLKKNSSFFKAVESFSKEELNQFFEKC